MDNQKTFIPKKLEGREAKFLEKNLAYYQDLEYRFSTFLCHATGSRMSYTHYDSITMQNECDVFQAEHHFSIVKSDILNLIENGAVIEDIKEYVEQLS